MRHRAARCLLAACCALMAPACHGLVGRQVRNPDEAEISPEAKILPNVSEPKILPITMPPGEPSFYSFCMPFIRKRIILVSVTLNYWAMFQNWYYYARPYFTSHDQLVVLVEDEDLEEEISRNGNWAFVDMEGNLHYESGSKKKLMKLSPPYGTQGYNEIVNKRPAKIGAFLDQGCTVLYSDIDMVWMSNPFKEIAAAGAHDLILADDDCQGKGKDFTRADDGVRMKLCTAFMYLQPTRDSRQFMEKWYSYESPDMGNQGPFNRALEEDYRGPGEVDYTLLPFEKFPPGCRAEDFYNQSVILHANYFVGLDTKVEFLKKYGVWHMNNASQTVD